MLSTAGTSLLGLIEPSSSLLSWYFQLLVIAFFINAFLPLASNDTLRYYGCYICYIFTTMVLSVLYIPVFLIRPRDPRNASLTHPFAVQISKAVGIQWELRGKEILAEDRAAVVAMNHQSMFDILAMGVISPVLEKFVTVARKEVFYYWPFGLGAWLCGVVFIDRLNGKMANQILDSTARIVHKHKTKMIMFPEGTRNRQGKTLLPFKKGAFRVAIESQCPVIPVVFSPYYFINSEKKYFGKGRIIIKALPAILTTGMTPNDIDMLIEKVRNVMETEYQALRREMDEHCLQVEKCR